MFISLFLAIKYPKDYLKVLFQREEGGMINTAQLALFWDIFCMGSVLVILSWYKYFTM